MQLIQFLFYQQNDCLAGQNIQRTAVHGNISTSSVPIQWPNIDVGNQRPQIALSTATSLKGSQQIAQSKLLDHSILLDIGDLN